jgi:putative transposase
MYDYRKMTLEERQQVLEERNARGFPLHSPPHFHNISGTYLITAACYEHRPIFDHRDDLSYLSNEMLDSLKEAKISPQAWIFLPNHYHFLATVGDIRLIGETLRLAHSRIATQMNGRHAQRGRKVWYQYNDRLIRNDRHYLATINYIHDNSVKHGYVDDACAWAWSSLHEYIKTQGWSWLARTAKEYPVLDYGKGWDWD